MKKITYIFLLSLTFSAMILSCTKQQEYHRTSASNEIKTVVNNTRDKVTILEFGSNCVPCTKMKIILDLLVKDYSEILAVEFIDIGSESGEKRAEANKIIIIPSQIFLDSTGTEFFRHKGYLPQEEIISILNEHGIVK